MSGNTVRIFIVSVLLMAGGLHASAETPTETVTVTANVQVDVFPEASVAVQVTVLVIEAEDERADRAPEFRSVPGSYLCALLRWCHGVDMSPSRGGLGLLVWD